MFDRKDLRQIGKLLKTHGTQGELVCEMHYDLEQEDMPENVLIHIDGLFVPFFVKAARQKGADMLLTLADITTKEDASALVGSDIYTLKSDDAQEDGEGDLDADVYVEDLVGFRVSDQNGIDIGELVDYDDSTANLLIQVRADDGKNYTLPLADELIIQIDTDRRTLALNLPEGILDI